MDKEMFRLVLLAIGVAIVAAVFAWDRLRNRRRGAPSTVATTRQTRTQRAEPRLEGGEVENLDGIEDDLDLIAQVIGADDHFDVSEPRVVRRRSPAAPEPQAPAPHPHSAPPVIEPDPLPAGSAHPPATSSSDVLLEDLPTAPARRTDAAVPQAARPHPAARDEAAAAAPANGPARVIALSVMARHGTISGIRLRKAFTEQQLSYGPMSIYHRLDGEETLFSVANLVAPGTFDQTTLDGFASPGLALFLTVPGPRDPVAAFDAMRATAEGLARRLDAELCDTRRRPLDGIAIDALRAEVQRAALG